MKGYQTLAWFCKAFVDRGACRNFPVSPLIGVNRQALSYFTGFSPLHLAIKLNFPLKVIQLYEMIVVRHGLMLVGPTGGGKSSNLHVLEETLSRLKQMGKEVLGAVFLAPLHPVLLFFTCSSHTVTSLAFDWAVVAFMLPNFVPHRYVDGGEARVVNTPLSGAVRENKRRTVGLPNVHRGASFVPKAKEPCA